MSWLDALEIKASDGRVIVIGLPRALSLKPMEVDELIGYLREAQAQARLQVRQPAKHWTKPDRPRDEQPDTDPRWPTLGVNPDNGGIEEPFNGGPSIPDLSLGNPRDPGNLCPPDQDRIGPASYGGPGG